MFDVSFFDTSILSPIPRLYPPACKPYGLEAEPEAITPGLRISRNIGNL